MGRDNHPRERQRKALDRKQGKKAPYDRILIVCEGEKTEPQYFREIQQFYKLQSANIHILQSEIGTAPSQVVEYAEALFLYGDHKKRIAAKAFDRVYAVFDRDEHLSYHDALKKAAALNGKYQSNLQTKVSFQAIPSVPCFELWLLIHFEAINHPLHRDEALRRLRTYIIGYDKGLLGAYAETKNRLPDAMQHAQRLATLTNAHNGSEPFTDVYRLVALLEDIKH